MYVPLLLSTTATAVPECGPDVMDTEMLPPLEVRSLPNSSLPWTVIVVRLPATPPGTVAVVCAAEGVPGATTLE